MSSLLSWLSSCKFKGLVLWLTSSTCLSTADSAEISSCHVGLQKVWRSNGTYPDPSLLVENDEYCVVEEVLELKTTLQLMSDHSSGVADVKMTAVHCIKFVPTFHQSSSSICESWHYRCTLGEQMIAAIPPNAQHDV